MADRTMKAGDTWPPLFGEASDASGNPYDLRTATGLQVRLHSGTHIITGTPVPVFPFVVDPDGTHRWNWRYDWLAGDTDNVGTYTVILRVTWAPSELETFPNEGSQTLEIEALP